MLGHFSRAIQDSYASDTSFYGQVIQRKLNQKMDNIMEDILINHITSKQHQEMVQQLVADRCMTIEQPYCVLHNEGIRSLAQVVFPDNIITLAIADNEITNFDGCHLPQHLTNLLVEHNQINKIKKDQLPESLLDLSLRSNGISTNILQQFELPSDLTILDLSFNNITFIPSQIMPTYLSQLSLHNNPLIELNGISEMEYLEESYMQNCGITSEMLLNVQFPAQMTIIELSGNNIKSFKGITFPTDLASLWLCSMHITSDMLKDLELPKYLSIVSFENNEIEDLSPLQLPERLLQLNLFQNPNIDLLTLRADCIHTLIVGYQQLMPLFGTDHQIEIQEIQFVNVRVSDDDIEQDPELLNNAIMNERGATLKKYFKTRGTVEIHMIHHQINFIAPDYNL